MKLKKVNAAAGLLTALILMCHAGMMCVSLYTGWYNFILCKSFAHMTESLLIIHAACSLIIMFFYNDGTSVALYRKDNKSLIIQRASALLMIVLIHMHTVAYAHMATGEILTTSKAIRLWVFEIIYIVTVMTHFAVSFSKAFVTLGLISSQKKFCIMQKIVYAVCTVAAIAAAGGVTVFFIGGLV